MRKPKSVTIYKKENELSGCSIKTLSGFVAIIISQLRTNKNRTNSGTAFTFLHAVTIHCFAKTSFWPETRIHTFARGS